MFPTYKLKKVIVNYIVPTIGDIIRDYHENELLIHCTYEMQESSWMEC